jgi:hypothetical protein
MSLHIVRGLSAPARSLRLSSLKRNLARRMTLAAHLFTTVGEEAPAQLWSVISSQEALAAVWRSYLGYVRQLLRRLATIMLGQRYTEKLEQLTKRAAEGDRDAKCMLSAYLTTLADFIAYMLRYPLYRDPLLTLVENAGAKGKPILAPHTALLVARLTLATKLLNYGCKALEEKEKAIVDAVKAILGLERGVEYRVTEIVAEALSRSVSEELEAIFYAAPADTRPGLNTTSLLLHLLMVSAGAATAVYALTSKTGFDRDPCLDAPVVRLAGLLHDAGKPIDPRNHVKASVEEAERLLEGLVPRIVLDAVKELIRSHHGEVSEKLSRIINGNLYCLDAERLHAILRFSDQTFTALDRLAKVMIALAEGSFDGVEEDVKSFVLEAKEKLHIIGEKLSTMTRLSPLEALKELYRGGHSRVRDAFFDLLSSPDGARLVAEATEAIARLFARPRSPKLEEKIREVLSSEERYPPQPCRGLSNGVIFGLAIVDIGGIQKGISESFKLRSMAGFSLLVDYLTMSIVPYAITLNGSPPEAVVFSGGGTVQAIVPLPAGENVEASIADRIQKTVSELMSIEPLYAMSLSGVRIRVSVESLREPIYTSTVLRAYQHMTSERVAGTNGVAAWLATLLSGMAEPCDSCGVRPGVVRVPGGERYCPICAARYAVSEQLGYKYDEHEGLGGYRGEILSIVLGEVEARELAQRYLAGEGTFDVLALIAGGFDRNYAIIKSDGNVAGMFMSSSLTPTMYFERSIRLDMATKNTIAWIADTIWSIAHGAADIDVWRAREILAAFIFGYMYAGGDDSLLIMPADIALPLAIMLAYGFSAEMGFLVTLSTGVVGAPVRHNIWWSIDAATALLDEVAKSKARPAAIKALLQAEPAPVAGFVAFDYTDGWGLNSHRAVWRHEYLAKRSLTLQPLPVLSVGNELGLLEVVASLSGEKVGRTELPRTLMEDMVLESSLRRLLESFLSGEAEREISDTYRSLVKYVPPKAQELVLEESEKARRAGFAEILLALSYAIARLEDRRRAKIKELVRTLVAKLGGSAFPFHDIYLVYKFARGD